MPRWLLVSVSLVAVSGCTFSLDRPLNAAEIRGRAVFALTGGSQAPAVGAHVTVENSPIAAVTDATGEFVLPGLPPGTYTIAITASQSGNGVADSGLRLPGITLIPLGSGQADGLDLGTLTLAAFGSISGSVKLNGSPAMGAVVALTGIAQTTATDGTFTFPNLAPGAYSVAAILVSTSNGPSASSPVSVTVAPRQPATAALSLTAVSEGSIAGLVRLASGNSVQGVVVQPTVSGNAEIPPVQPGNAGDYSEPSLPPGVYTVTASNPGYTSITVSFLVVGGDTTQVPPITLVPGATPDAGPVDAGPVDSGPVDSGPVDSGPVDSGPVDSGPVDSGPVDSGPVDSGPVDSGPVDSGPVDAGPAGIDGGIWVTTIAGNGLPCVQDGTGGATGTGMFLNAAGMTMDSQGNILVADSMWIGYLRKIDSSGNVTTLIGVTDAGTNPMVVPVALAADTSGNVYVADSSKGCLWAVSPSFAVSPLAGICAGDVANGLGVPSGVALNHAGNLYVTDVANHVVEEITPAGATTTFAGTYGVTGFADGAPGTALFSNPAAVAVDPRAGGLTYVADAQNQAIRAIDSSGNVTTIAGRPSESSTIRDGTGGPGGTANLASPSALAVDASGNIFFLDGTSGVIRKIDMSGATPQVTTLSNTETFGFADGPGGPEGLALFSSPTGLAVDSQGNLLISDSGNLRIRRMTISPGATGLTHAPSFFQSPANTGLTVNDRWGYINAFGGVSARTGGSYELGIAVTPGDKVFVGDYALDELNHYCPTGDDCDGGSDGPGVLSASPYGLAATSTGSIYIALADANQIALMDSSGTVSIVAGLGTAGYKDGPTALAQFASPRDIALDSTGNIYVADALNNRIRLINTSGTVSTFAGSGAAGFKDATDPMSATFFHPAGVAVDADGNVYVADQGNNALREITTAGVKTLAGTGTIGYQDGPGATATFNLPAGVAVDSAKRVFIADTWNQEVRVYDPVSASVGTLWSGADAPLWSVDLDSAGNAYVNDAVLCGEGCQAYITQLSCPGSWCGPGCFDTVADPNHCGDCNNVCKASAGQTPACAGGRCSPITTVAPDLPLPELGLQLAGSSLYWLVGGYGVYGTDLMSVPVTGGTPSTVTFNINANLLASDGTNVYASTAAAVLRIPPGGGTRVTLATTSNVVALTADSNNVYWSTSDGNILSIPSSLTQAGTPTTLASFRSGLDIGTPCLAVGESDGNIYWVEYNSNVGAYNMMSTLSAGDGSISLVVGGMQAEFQGPFAIDSNNVYWVQQQGAVVSASLSGSGVVRVVSSNLFSTSRMAATPTAIVTDGVNVYWTYPNPSAVWRAQVTGGNAIELGVAGLDPIVYSPAALALDANNVYWTDGSDSTGGEILSAAK